MPRRNKYSPSTDITHTYEAIGIACCRWHYDRTTKKCIPQIILVQKRHTYQYIDFLFGRYNYNDDSRLQYLFSHMTPAEKMDILTFRFDVMWSKLWSNDKQIDEYRKQHTIDFRKPTQDSANAKWTNAFSNKAHIYNRPWKIEQSQSYSIYIRRRLKFEMLLRSKNGITSTDTSRLRRLIDNSKNAAQLWEMPKGRCKPDESDLVCAIREFTEESSILKKDIRLILDAPIFTETFRDDGIEYKNKYYLAMIGDHSIMPKIRFSSVIQTSEIDDVRWIGANEINYLCESNRRLAHITSHVFNAFRKYC